MAKLILGVAGEMGSGKGVVAKHLIQNHNADSHKFSQILRDVLDRLHIQQTRESITALSVSLRTAFGQDVLAQAMYHEAYEDQKDIIIIDGVRRLEDIKFLRQLPYFKLIYIEADMLSRYERITHRSENGTEQQKSFVEFKASHEYDTEKTIPDLKNYADYVIQNDGTYVELYTQVDEIVKQNIA